MAMSTEKLGRLASNSIGGPVEDAVQVRWGWPLSVAGTIVALFLMIGVGMLLRLPFLYGTVIMIGAWTLRRLKKLGDGVMARDGDEVVVIEARLARRNPVRDVLRRYPAGTAARYEPSSRWWRAPAIIVGDDEWLVASAYESSAELAYGEFG